MGAYTVSRLAQEADVSVNVVRDYVLRGLLRPASHTEGGYGLYDAGALERLRFVRALFEAGIGLGELVRLCHVLDSQAGDAGDCLAHLRALVAARREALALLDRQLAGMVVAERRRTATEHHHG
ncbi:mercuric resistance transcriptional repressor MerD [Chitinivorax sp. PXF-14]|uniref:HTH-type transcriptional regulator MerD n=1 Tax=Burkholderia cepacia TaxID=292 RepID=A0A8I1DM58_BURCE|nr:mercuric resistance transcriptional repressor MerD [Ralstonia pickettii]MBH9681730.1 mercuric resistance transcriptional repressor protein MerD [Burkholderia cepacia]MBB0025178.1 mercuric resistance transcriptional repressor protein MerD [Ralstonia pickettii]MBB0035966.1 mercuric resistance transcriptional repressor protein MerD [Ralstonia pickettii]MBB0098506.1 mercuric resistance transcriptional repressor protein MerD [Ralstonia pickettii]MBB0108435.1 mercuric resistance transcriptional r